MVGAEEEVRVDWKWGLFCFVFFFFFTRSGPLLCGPSQSRDLKIPVGREEEEKKLYFPKLGKVHVRVQ